MKFRTWFDKNLIVGPFPIKSTNNIDFCVFDIVINVSCEYSPEIVSALQIQNPLIETHWFPMNEAKKDIGLNSIYAAIIILRRAEKEGKRVYLHCHAGANRSPTVQAAYYFVRTGMHYEPVISCGYINRLVANCHRGYLPPKTEMEKFLVSLSKEIDHKPVGGFLDTCKLEINNF